jgi:DNA-binding MarR family transcriptional regulator
MMINIRDAHIKLLIELSDDQGHSNKELAESLKCTREYITMLFKELNKNIFIFNEYPAACCGWDGRKPT